MKIRNDFVTNSSSSSFIVALKDNWNNELLDSIGLDNIGCGGIWEILTLDNYKKVLNESLLGPDFEEENFENEDLNDEDEDYIDYFYNDFQLPKLGLFRKLITETEVSDELYYNLYNTLEEFHSTQNRLRNEFFDQRDKMNSQAYEELRVKYLADQDWRKEKNKEFCRSFFVGIKNDKNLFSKFLLILADNQLNGNTFEMMKFYITAEECVKNGKKIIYLDICCGTGEKVSEAFGEYGTLIGEHCNC